MLDGRIVSSIHSNLTAGVDITQARRLISNLGLSFQGSIKRGKFDIEGRLALKMLGSSGNPNERPNSDVIFPYLNGMDLTRRNRNVWIIDFGERGSLTEASLFATPFEHVELNVKPERQHANQAKAREEWWRHWNTRPEMNAALRTRPRFLATPRVAKHRLFVWLQPPSYPDCQLIVFARQDDYFFGVLQSRAHEVWALITGTQLREKESGFRYTPTTCFETFPFPEPSEEQREAIAKAAKELDDLRTNWLNPREWTREEILEFPGSIDGPWARYVQDPNEHGVGTVKYPRLIPKGDNEAEQLAKRTLTNLYNERPTWLDLAHRKLDEAVFAAYGWDVLISDDEILARLLELNQTRASKAK